jgi:hypothetical protein
MPGLSTRRLDGRIHGFDFRDLGIRSTGNPSLGRIGFGIGDPGLRRIGFDFRDLGIRRAGFHLGLGRIHDFGIRCIRDFRRHRI